MQGITRRRFLKYLGSAAGLAFAAGIGYYFSSFNQISKSVSTIISTSSYTPEGNLPEHYKEFLQWLASVSKPYSGATLNISMEAEATPRALQKRDPDFFKASGINVQYDLKPYTLHLSDISLMTRTQSPTYDIYSVDNQDIAFFKDHILSPDDLADKYRDLTFEPIRGDDFFPLPWALTATYPPSSLLGLSSNKSKTLFLPLDMPVMIQFYRKDIYDSLGIKPASTWEEYYENMRAISSSKRIPFPTVAQASVSVSSVFEYLNHLASFGGRLWDFDGQQLIPLIDSDEAIAALENYVGLARYSDPASFTYSWQDVTTDLSRAIASTAIQWDDYAYWMDDPLRSLVPNTFGYSQNPSGARGAFSTYGGAGIGISLYSKNPEAAWLWLQWATALGTQEMTFLDTFRSFPTRKAVLNESMIREALSKDQYRALRITEQVWNSGKVVSLLSFPKWWHILDILSTHINNAWIGNETPKQALSKAREQIDSWGKLTF